MLTPLKTSLAYIITLLQSTSKIVFKDEMQTVFDGKTNSFFFSEIQLSRHSYLEPMDREGQGNSGIFHIIASSLTHMSKCIQKIQSVLKLFKTFINFLDIQNLASYWCNWSDIQA